MSNCIGIKANERQRTTPNTTNDFIDAAAFTGALVRTMLVLVDNLECLRQPTARHIWDGWDSHLLAISHPDVVHDIITRDNI